MSKTTKYAICSICLTIFENEIDYYKPMGKTVQAYWDEGCDSCLDTDSLLDNMIPIYKPEELEWVELLYK